MIGAHAGIFAIAAIVSAPFIGSFLAALALRLPARRPVVFARSACDACGRPLAALDLVPLASFAASRGVCRYCGAQIDRLHPAMELGALVIAVWAAFLVSGWILLASCLFGWTLLTLAAIDWRTNLLPDVLTLPLIVAGLAVARFVDPASVVAHLVGALVGFATFALLAAIFRRLRGRDGLGLGDAKLLAAVGAWLGWMGLPTVVLLGALIGLALVLARRLAGEPIDAATRIPFGPALAAGAWIVWLYGPLVPT